MRTLQLADGDLVIGTNGHATVTGASMVAQDLRCALGEPIGTDRFHPGYGSALETFVGMVLDEGARFTVEQEANRVIGNYVAIQNDRISRDAVRAARSRYSTDDIVAEVSEVRVVANFDAVQVFVEIKTMAGQSVIVSAQAGG